MTASDWLVAQADEAMVTLAALRDLHEKSSTPYGTGVADMVLDYVADELR
jgi:hypothetical protein